MTSTTSSHSEGEISTSESEKASQTSPSQIGISVDRHTRTNVSSVRKPRSRSRSPYRASRGEKRRREDGGYVDNPAELDSRSQKLRHDGDRYLSDRNHGRRPHLEPKSRYTARNHTTFDYQYDRGHSLKRPRISSRSRSRSPFRHSPSDGKPGRRQDSARSKHDESKWGARTSRSGSRPRDEQSVSERSKPSGVALASKSNAKPSENQSSATLPTSLQISTSQNTPVIMKLSHATAPRQISAENMS